MEFSKKKPIYLQIADNFCERILRRELEQDDKIPSIRETAISIEVNPNTVTRSYAFLEEKGIITIVRGVGFFITPHADSIVLKIKQAEFFEDNLPALFQMMDLLSISCEEITKLYHKKTHHCTEK